MNDEIIKMERVEEPIFDFKNKFYTPFDLNTRKITFHVTRVKNDTACLNLECSGFCVGKIQLPVEFLSKLTECKLSPTEFVTIK